MSCDCENIDKELIIKFICDDIEDLDDTNKWETYLEHVPNKYKKASIRWSLTKTNTRIWLARVLKNMQKNELISWAHDECFCMDQFTSSC
jgi:hypothetical protein